MKYLSIFFLAALMSCKLLQPISLVPTFNAAIVTDVIELGKQVDDLYISMEQNEDKIFDTYVQSYTNGEVLINSIIVRDQSRPKGELITKQAILFRNLFLKYRDEHKKKIKLNNSEIRIYKQYLKDQHKALLVSEMSLK